MNPFDALVAMFAADPVRARRVAHDHRVDTDGRCMSCHSGGASSGRTMGCTIGAASRAAIQSTKHPDAGLPTPPTTGKGGSGETV